MSTDYEKYTGIKNNMNCAFPPLSLQDQLNGLAECLDWIEADDAKDALLKDYIKIIKRAGTNIIVPNKLQEIESVANTVERKKEKALKEEAEVAEREEKYGRRLSWNLITSTGWEIPGGRLDKVLGCVQGVGHMNMISFDGSFSFFSAGADNLFSVYDRALSSAKNKAYNDLLNEAKKLEANAVLGILFSITTFEVRGSSSHVQQVISCLASGTAVRVAKNIFSDNIDTNNDKGFTSKSAN